MTDSDSLLQQGGQPPLKAGWPTHITPENPPAEAGGKANVPPLDGDAQPERLLAEKTLDTDTLLRTGQALEALALSLRQANEHLVIASLDASAREAKTAEAHRKQTLFLSMLAHELRNPLAPIAMSIELLGRTPGLPPDIQRLLAILARQTAQLRRLVDDLLDATRINSGKIRIHKAAVLVSQLLAQAVETSQPVLDARGQTVRLRLPLESVWIDGDMVRLSQLFSNLIINASKFSPEHAAIHLSAQVRAGSVDVSVKDDGIGIPPDFQPFVFDLFTQGPAGDGQLVTGLGIGLSLVKTIAELHGGQVRVVSEGDGMGTEFITTLPVIRGSPSLTPGGAVPTPDRQTPQPEASRARRVLLIDDNADINASLRGYLRAAGHEVACAGDGATGLQMERLRAHDVICCDIGLPGMDGYEVARQLRQTGCTACLIAISGYGQDEDRERALKAGFTHYLVKPVRGQTLLDLIGLS